MTPALATAAPARVPNLTPRDAAEWATSVAAVRALDDAALVALAATLAATPLASTTAATRDLYLPTKSEVSIRCVEVSLAAPVHPNRTEVTWPTATL